MTKKPTNLPSFLGISDGTSQGTAVLIRWSGERPVLVILPHDKPIQLLSEGARRDVQLWIPTGPVLATRLTEKEKQLLVERGMDAQLVGSGRVLSVSDEIANRMESDRKALLELATKCGLSADDLDRIQEAKKKLTSTQAMSIEERRAAEGLRNVLSCPRPKKQPGRTAKVTASERIQMRLEGRTLKKEGRSLREIVMNLAQKYEVKPSYAKRILEDAIS
jgi:hypothetical protein